MISIKELLTNRASRDCALVICNQPISVPYFSRIWDAAGVRICADGGCSHLMAHDAGFWPDYVVGDLDSMDPSLKQALQERDVKLVHDGDQDSTDLEKALKFAFAKLDKSVALVTGALGGPRLDHTLNAFHACHAFQDKHVFLMDSQSSAFIVPVGKTTVIVDEQWEGPHCGIFPLCGESHVATKGLKWNLDGARELQMGTFVSVSNKVADEEINFDVKGSPVLFVLELRSQRLSVE